MSHTVLLVDDEPKVLAGLQRALYREPYEVLCACSAKEALHMLQARPVDVMISDQDMPSMKGTELLARVREQFPDTVRFILTGKATLEVAIQAINEGAVSRFFTKPYNNKDLAITIRQALQHKELMVEAQRLLRTVRHQIGTLEQLEDAYPGITKVRRSPSGAVIASPEEMSIEELLHQLRQETARLEGYMDDPE